MLKYYLKRFLIQFKRLIARCWIVPLDDLLWEMVGIEQSSRWYALPTTLAWIRDLGRLIHTGLRMNISRWDGPEWSIIYISDDSTDSEKELQYLLSPGSLTETKLGRAFLWQIPALIRCFVAQECLVICDLNRLAKWKFQGMYCIRVFPWARAFLDISVPLNLVVGRMTESRRKDLSRLKKQGFEFGASRDLTDLEFFYHKMYIPYITGRFQSRAIIVPYDLQQKLLAQRGKLLCIRYRDNLVAASLGTLRRYGKTFSPLHVGVESDHMYLVKQDLLVALRWHTIRWAHANHLHLVDFGKTRARLNDGVFLFKHRWGMRFERDITTHTMWTLIGKDLPLPLIRHLNDLAFIAEVGKEYRCVVFDSDGASLSDKELARREKIIAQAGLDGLLILRPWNGENSSHDDHNHDHTG
jgi:hypothetical protein